MINMKAAKESAISWKWIIAALPIILYSFSTRQSMGYIEDRHHVIANFWDYILIPLNDVYLIVYYIFPLIIFISSIYINRTFDYTKLIRLGSYKRWIITKLKQLFIMDIFVISTFMGAMLITAINTPFSLKWSNVGTINESGNEILYILQLYFSNPFVATILQLLLSLLTLITIQLILCTLYVIYKKQSVLHLLNAALFVFGIAGFKILPTSLSFISIPNYLSLFHGVATFNNFVTPFVIMVIVFTISIIFANKIDQNRSEIKQYFYKKIPLLIYMLLCITGIWFNIERYANGDLSDILVGTFIGTTNEMFSLLSFAYYVVVYVGFVYFVQLLLQRYLSEMSFYTMIRYRSMNKWFLSWFPNILKSILLLLLSLFVVTISIAVFKGIAFTLSENWFQIIYHFMINGFLQLLFFVLLVIIVSLFTKDVLKSFIALLVLTIFMLPGFRLNNFVPIGLNSMGYIFENISIYFISLILTGYIVVEIIVLLFLLNKKDYTF